MIIYFDCFHPVVQYATFFCVCVYGVVIRLTVKIQNKIFRIMVCQNLQLQVEICLRDTSTIPCH